MGAYKYKHLCVHIHESQKMRLIHQELLDLLLPSPP